MTGLDINSLAPTRGKMLVRRYTKPNEARGIIIPDAYREDDTMSLWEYVKAHPSVSETIGVELKEGDIIHTRAWAAKMIDREHGFIDVERNREVIVGYYVW